MALPRLAAAVACVFSIALAGCDTLLGAQATPVPGAAATAARAAATPIPTTVRGSVPGSPVPSPAAVTSAPSPRPSPSPARPPALGVTDEDVTDIHDRLQRVLASPDLSGMEDLLLAQVSFSTPEGGQTLPRADALNWLRDRTGPGIRVTAVERSSLAVSLQAMTEGWPAKTPITDGRVSFNFRRYTADGQQDQERGTWKIDVITVE